MNPTEQQLIAARHQLTAGELVAIVAVAGSGKSTTLKLTTQEQPNRRFLYACFGNANAVEARTKFPKNVECRTWHSIAYGPMAKVYGRQKIGAMIRTREIMDILSLKWPVTAIHVNNTLNRFLASSDRELSEKHVCDGSEDSPDYAKTVLNATRRLWAAMCDRTSKVPLTHDGYLKIFLTSEPKLNAYDAILVDEAQDTNPVVASYVLSQPQAGKAVVLVGDPHQSVYGFRGAKNVMESVLGSPGVTKFALTQSFRVTQSVADVASDVLNVWKGDPVRIEGMKQITGAPQSRAFVARNNSTIVEAAFNYVARQGVEKIHFAGTSEKSNYDPTRAYGFDELLDAYRLWTRNKEGVTTPYMKRFADYEELKVMAEVGKDVEVGKLCRMVESWKHKLPEVLAKITKAATSQGEAEITLSSAHRSKGLEWDEVELGDDFMDLNNGDMFKANMEPHEFSEEVNLIYVAVTRSGGSLTVNESLAEWLNRGEDEAPDLRQDEEHL